MKREAEIVLLTSRWLLSACRNLLSLRYCSLRCFSGGICHCYVRTWSFIRNQTLVINAELGKSKFSTFNWLEYSARTRRSFQGTKFLAAVCHKYCRCYYDFDDVIT